MKRVLFISFFVIFLLSLSSCNNNQPQPAPQKVTTTVTAEKVTYSDGRFYVEQQIIVSGNTVWGISEKVYGTGMQWRDIVTLNPFLNTPDRLYYNPDRKMWIVKIYPGEVLNIGGQKVYPSCTYERTTTATTTEPAAPPSSPSIEWWGWLLLGIVALLILLAIFSPYFRSRVVSAFSSSNSSSSSSSVVNITNDSSIDLATRAYFIGRQQNLRDRTVEIIADASKRDQLRSFAVVDGDFFAGADFKKCQQKNEKIEPKKDDVK